MDAGDGSEISIRKAGPEDAEAIIALTGREFRSASVDARIEDLLGGAPWLELKGATIRDELRRSPEGCLSTLVNAIASRGVIANIAVSSECQGRGLGRTLLNKALNHFRSLGLKQAKIETLTTNEAGAHLYPSVGFTEVARQIHFAMSLEKS